MPVAAVDATVGDPSLVVVAVCSPLLDAVEIVVPVVFTAVGVDPVVDAAGSVRLMLAAPQKDCANVMVSVGPCMLFKISRVSRRGRDCSSGGNGIVCAQGKGRERYTWVGKTGGGGQERH